MSRPVLKFGRGEPKTIVVRSLVAKGLLVSVVLVLVGAPAALADTASSSNWSGYAVHRIGVRFTRVSGAWRQPKASCTTGRPTYSAVWVGLGGFAVNSEALEQIGTEVDCTSAGRISSSAWFELVPAPSHAIRMRVRPGDAMSASVSVSGSLVSLSLTDRTTHRTFRRTLGSSQVDVSSAEWIVEAPSACLNSQTCQTLPLADFGSAKFTRAQVRSLSGHTGPISDPAWSATQIRLNPSGRRFVVYNGSGPAYGVATPSPLSAAGSAFAVTYEQVTVEGSPFVAGSAPLRGRQLVHPLLVPRP